MLSYVCVCLYENKYSRAYGMASEILFIWKFGIHGKWINRQENETNSYATSEYNLKRMF